MLLAGLLLHALYFVSAPLGAEENDATQAEQQTEIPTDKFDRGTPRRSGEGFIRATDISDYETAAEYLEWRIIRGPAKERSCEHLARRLEVII